MKKYERNYKFSAIIICAVIAACVLCAVNALNIAATDKRVADYESGLHSAANVGVEPTGRDTADMQEVGDAVSESKVNDLGASPTGSGNTDGENSKTSLAENLSTEVPLSNTAEKEEPACSVSTEAEVNKAATVQASYDGTDYGEDTFLPDIKTPGALTPNSACAMLVEAGTGEVLYESNIDAKRPIASMVKIMTLVLIFDALDAGKFTMDDNIRVSERAFSMGGSQAFLDKNQNYKASELILSIIIASANDSCVAMAEHISGSVELFVEEMNKRASSLGMNDTVFVNVTGLPQAGQFSTARDVSKMTRELVKHKEYFNFSKTWMYDLKHPDGRVTGLTNTNKLSRFYEGCDGGKTGFTNESMHCLSATATRGGMRLIAVVLAGKDSKGRFADVSSMLDYGFANYESKKYLSKETVSAKVRINNSLVKSINLTPKEDLFMFGKKGSTRGEVKYEFPSFLNAPVKKGQEVGKAYLVDANNNITASTALIANSDAVPMTFMDRIRQIIGAAK